MKFWKFACLLVFAATVVVAAEEEAVAFDDLADSALPKSTIDFYIDYSIAEFPDVSNLDVADLTNGDYVSLHYTCVNNENENITLIGVTGSFKDPASGEIRANISAGNVGPLILQPGEVQKFEQKIELDVFPGNYMLMPQLIVVYQELIRMVHARGQLVTISDVPTSFFDPQLLFLEFVLLVVLGGLGYVFATPYLQKYNKGTAPVKKTDAKVDQSWIPKEYLKDEKPAKRTRAKKAY